MSHTVEALHHDDGSAVKEIWKVTGILSLLTIVELVLGFVMMRVDDASLRLSIKGGIVILYCRLLHALKARAQEFDNDNCCASCPVYLVYYRVFV